MLRHPIYLLLSCLLLVGATLAVDQDACAACVDRGCGYCVVNGKASCVCDSNQFESGYQCNANGGSSFKTNIKLGCSPGGFIVLLLIPFTAIVCCAFGCCWYTCIRQKKSYGVIANAATSETIDSTEVPIATATAYKDNGTLMPGGGVELQPTTTTDTKTFGTPCRDCDSDSSPQRQLVRGGHPLEKSKLILVDQWGPGPVDTPVRLVGNRLVEIDRE